MKNIDSVITSRNQLRRVNTKPNKTKYSISCLDARSRIGKTGRSFAESDATNM